MSLAHTVEVYICPVCGESFDKQVWHCPYCVHHWPLDRQWCWNCHEGKQRKGLIAQPFKNEA